MLHDHLKAGKYDNSNQNLRKEVSGISNTNNITERDFGILSRFMREESYSNMITYEALIMSRANKLSAWHIHLNLKSAYK